MSPSSSVFSPLSDARLNLHSSSTLIQSHMNMKSLLRLAPVALAMGLASQTFAAAPVPSNSAPTTAPLIAPTSTLRSTTPPLQ